MDINSTLNEILVKLFRNINAIEEHAVRSGEYKDIYIVNDSQEEVCLDVCIRDVLTKEVVFEGKFNAEPNASKKIGSFLGKNAFSFYEIVWNGSKNGYNHFVDYQTTMEINEYMRCLQSSQYRDKTECFK